MEELRDKFSKFGFQVPAEETRIFVLTADRNPRPFIRKVSTVRTPTFVSLQRSTSQGTSRQAVGNPVAFEKRVPTRLTRDSCAREHRTISQPAMEKDNSPHANLASQLATMKIVVLVLSACSQPDISSEAVIRPGWMDTCRMRHDQEVANSTSASASRDHKRRSPVMLVGL